MKDERGEEEEKFECLNDGEEEKEETFVKMKVTRALGDEEEEYRI